MIFVYKIMIFVHRIMIGDDIMIFMIYIREAMICCNFWIEIMCF